MLTQVLNLISTIGIVGWIAFAISLAGIGATAEDAWRTWPDKGDDPHWRRITVTRILALASGAALSAVVAGFANGRSDSLQRQLIATGQIAQAAQIGVDDARGRLARLRTGMESLAMESQDALKMANAEDQRAKQISASVAQLNNETQRRLHVTNSLARQAAMLAGESQESAQRAADIASRSKALAQVAANNAFASQQAAVAAAVKARVYRLPDQTIAAIISSVRGLANNTTVFIACAPGLELACSQLASAFRTVGLDPTVRPAVSFFSAGLDANPLARTPNPNITVGYMQTLFAAAQSVDRALVEAGLHSELVAFPENTVSPNLEILFHYVGDAP